MLHRDCDLGPILAVTASIRATRHGCEAEFRLEGDISRIVVPQAAPSVRTDYLWQTTCFEIFWQPIGDTYYREFNLSPSGRWAAYDFADFRDKTRDSPVDAISVACSHNDRELVLKASIAAELPTPAQVALNAIVDEGRGGEGEGLQFWALAFPPGKPEFHSEACRQWVVERD